MRELKFRAWDNGLKRYLTEEDGLELHLDGSYAIFFEGGWYFPDITLEQYTGLKDKSGKEIYEGDVVDVWIGGDKQNTSYVVEDMRELYSEFHHDDGYYQFSKVEIIGNIHENPGLLGEEGTFVGVKKGYEGPTVEEIERTLKRMKLRNWRVGGEEEE